MLRRYVCIVAPCLLAALAPIPAIAQPARSDSEGALRKAVAGYIASWNSHDIASWAKWLTDDVAWVDASDPSPKRSKETVSAFAAYYVSAHELDLKIKKLIVASDGLSAIVLLEGKWLELPKKDGKYAREWPRDLLLSRWRFEGGGWRLSYMNNHSGSSAEIAKAEGLI